MLKRITSSVQRIVASVLGNKEELEQKERGAAIRAVMCPRRLYGPNHAVNPGPAPPWCTDTGFDPKEMSTEDCSLFFAKDWCWQKWFDWQSKEAKLKRMLSK